MAGIALVCAELRAADGIMPIEDVRPGMIGVGRTVFKGSEIEEFKVEILGVLENTAPRQNLILARLSGGPLQETGVIMGMSGSPVYVGDQLIGAVSTAFPFSKEPIAGITPIQEMISLTTAAAKQTPGTSTSSYSIKRALTLDELMAPLHDGPGTLPQGASYIKLPLSTSGFSRTGLDTLSSAFSGFNFVPVAGGQSAGKFEKAIEQAIEPFKPGSAVSVQLVRGDLDLSAVGTVTMVDGSRVFAFGHPFFNMGSIQFPMSRAEVISLLPSLYASFKISSTAEIVGTIDQDRATAIAGTLGKQPPMIPINVDLETSMGAKEKYRFEIVTDRFLSPILTYITLLSTVTSRERQYGDSTLRMSASINLGGGTTIPIGDTFTGSGPAGDLAMLVATPVYFLMTNPFKDISVSSIDVAIRSDEGQKSARLERAEFDRDTYHAGDTLKMKVHLRGDRDERVVEEASFELPRSLKAGDYMLYVGTGSVLDAMDAAELRGGYTPQSYAQLVRALSSLRRNNSVYVRLSERRPGLVIRGEDFTDLPPSAAAVVGSRANSQESRRILYSPLLDSEIGTTYAVSGYRLLQLKIRDL